MDIKKLTAPCGLTCWACAYYKKNITGERAQMAAGQIGIEAKEVSCDGCRSEKGCSFEYALAGEQGCLTKRCVEKKGLHNCSECDEFPCENLMPVVEMAQSAPHNTKVYNLSRIRLKGLETWAAEAALIQKKYFEGKFIYGQAPVLPEDMK
ncbi:MAG: DUF3795 domain-containing protein [Desulfobacter sp.]